jgi:putative SOS response-associated peptidase YedK
MEMCGRFTNRYSSEELRALYGLAETALPASNFAPHYNIAPTQDCAIVRLKDGRRELSLLKWGLVPSSAKDMSGAAKLINARAENIDGRPDVRSAFRHRRCLVVADGFYEWKKLTAKDKQPYYVTTKDKAPFAFAGLHEYWIPREGARIETFTIITCPPNKVVAELHDRMPVMLPPAAWKLWLGEELASPDKVKSILKPFPADATEAWPVDKKVGNVANDEPGLIVPAS